MTAPARGIPQLIRDDWTFKKNVTIDGTLTLNGTFTYGDAVTDTMILKGRVATGSAAGAALAIGATYTWGEGQELRYTISSWAGTGNTFNGLYLRPQSDLDNASGSLRGAEIMAVANASAVSDLKGVFGEAYIKGDTAETIATVYGVHAEVSFDASRANSITLTEATPLLAKILAGKVADYTKFHGAILRFGDMDGGTRTFGSGVILEDDAGTSGTNLLTNGFLVSIGTEQLFNVSGAISGHLFNFSAESTAVEITAASASIPANTGYLLIKVAATTYRVPVYANS